jgi:hypothetical protein
MSVVGDLVSTPGDGLPLVLGVEEAAEVLRIGRTLAYALARRYEATGGVEGLPVIRLGGCLRVPRWALLELALNGRTVSLGEPVAAASPSRRLLEVELARLAAIDDDADTAPVDPPDCSDRAALPGLLDRRVRSQRVSRPHEQLHLLPPS